jgi:hypothetical protein
VVPAKRNIFVLLWESSSWVGGVLRDIELAEYLLQLDCWKRRLEIHGRSGQEERTHLHEIQETELDLGGPIGPLLDMLVFSRFLRC